MAVPLPPPMSGRALRARQRRSRRRRLDLLMTHAMVLTIRDETTGSKSGSRTVRRKRMEVDEIMRRLGPYVRKAYRMNPEDFDQMHATLEPALVEYFSTNRRGRKRRGTTNGHISTRLRLSAAIRYFAGGKTYDIMVSHGLGRSSIYDSIWGVVDVVNESPNLAFNDGGALFPERDGQLRCSPARRHQQMKRSARMRRHRSCCRRRRRRCCCRRCCCRRPRCFRRRRRCFRSPTS